jgi:hypothetical protein
MGRPPPEYLDRRRAANGDQLQTGIGSAEVTKRARDGNKQTGLTKEYEILIARRAGVKQIRCFYEIFPESTDFLRLCELFGGSAGDNRDRGLTKRDRTKRTAEKSRGGIRSVLRSVSKFVWCTGSPRKRSISRQEMSGFCNTGSGGNQVNRVSLSNHAKPVI